MKIIFGYPPNIEAIRAKFDIRGRAGVVFCYGNTLFNPSGQMLPPEIIAHEEVHAAQQAKWAGGPAKWWEDYIANKTFRFHQEFPAHVKELQIHVALNSGRQAKRKYIRFVAKRLSGPLYGHMIAAEDAKRRLLAELSGTADPFYGFPPIEEIT